MATKLELEGEVTRLQAQVSELEGELKRTQERLENACATIAGAADAAPAAPTIDAFTRDGDTYTVGKIDHAKGLLESVRKHFYGEYELVATISKVKRA